MRGLRGMAAFLAGCLGLLAGSPDGSSAGDEFHPHHVAVMFGGMTPLSETSETSFALGLDYEYRLDELWGVGGVVDLTFGDHKRTTLFATGLSYRPVAELRLSTGPGFEIVEKDKPAGKTENKVYFVWGFGAYYEFHLEDWAVGPAVYLDFVGETKTNLTYGLSVGRGF